MNKPLLASWIVGSLALVAGASIRFDGPELDCDGYTTDGELREQLACGTGSTEEEAEGNSWAAIDGLPTCKQNCYKWYQSCAQTLDLYGEGAGMQCYEDHNGRWHCCYYVSAGAFYSNTCVCEGEEPPPPEE